MNPVYVNMEAPDGSVIKDAWLKLVGDGPHFIRFEVLNLSGARPVRVVHVQFDHDAAHQAMFRNAITVRAVEQWVKARELPVDQATAL